MSSRANIIDDSPPATLAVVSLGSNLRYRDNSSHAVLKSAVESLQRLAMAPLRVSSCYRSGAVDCPPGSPDFLNAIAIIPVASGASALDFLHQLQAIELELGRRRDGVRNQARTLDLDLIAWGDLQLRTVELELPHPRALERLFVLRPLAELLPELVLPGQVVTVQELLQQHCASHAGASAAVQLAAELDL